MRRLGKGSAEAIITSRHFESSIAWRSDQLRASKASKRRCISSSCSMTTGSSDLLRASTAFFEARSQGHGIPPTNYATITQKIGVRRGRLRARSAAITRPADSGITGILPRSPSVPRSCPETAGNLAFGSLRVVQADTDERLVELWLHGRNALTVEAYTRDVGDFLKAVGKSIRALTIGDLQAWVSTLEGAPATRRRRLAAAKSLLTFASRIGYVPFKAGAVVRLPPAINVLAERILTEEQVVRLIALERDPRNHALLQLLYLAALSVSEAYALRWAACKARRGAGQLTVVGKRKVRSILLPASMWRELVALRGDAGPDDPVFRSRQGGALDPMSVQRIVKAAAIRAGLPKAVSPHWLRHAHCSHALDRGANPALVRDTAGRADLRVTSVYSHAQPKESSARFLVG
jgi:integrase/recombinase XerD